MKDKVKRYHYAYPEDKCAECGSDEYVAFKDYAALLCKHQTLAAENAKLRADIKTIKDSLKKHTIAKRNIEDGISEITVRVTDDALKALEEDK